MKRAVRFMMIAAAIVLCLSILGSVSFLAIHSQHDCTGKECLVCDVIMHCEQRLRSAATAGKTALLLLTISLTATILNCAVTHEAPCETLVSLKVEMLN